MPTPRAKKTKQPQKRQAPASPTGAPIGPLLEALERAHPGATTELDWQTPLQLLVATILSAQCTDERVNRTTPALFAAYPTAAALAAATQQQIEPLIQQTGFYRQKAKAIRGAARVLADRHGGEVPRSMEAMLELPGVARKTANVVLGTAYGLATGVVVDTHVSRVSARLGLTAETDPLKIERDLMALVPEDRWVSFGHQLVLHGRYTCTARRPQCSQCPLATLCPAAFRVEGAV